MTRRRWVDAGPLGLGVVACGACCAGPIIGFLATAGVGAVVGAVVFGLAGVVVVALVGGVLWRRRQRRQRRQQQRRAPGGTTETRSVAVEPPRLRTGA